MDRTDKIRLALVDDHPLILSGLSAMLASYPSIDIRFCANSATNFFHELPNHTIDMAVLDIILPDVSGVEIARRMRSEHPDIRLMMLSSECNQEIMETLLNIGIDGFISKLSETSEIVHAIESIADGMSYFGADVSLILDGITAAKNCKSINFTDRKQEIINLSARGLQGKEIAQQLQISSRTVETHKNNIFKKLGINNSVELVRYAVQHGIIRM